MQMKVIGLRQILDQKIKILWRDAWCHFINDLNFLQKQKRKEKNCGSTSLAK